MEDEIKVGEYVRIDNGMIIKYEFLEESENFEVFFGQKGKGFTFEDMEEFEDFIRQRIIKHSKNIIDLIEEGDYVNGKYVYSIGTAIGNLPIINHTDGTFTPSNLIESIVTKEQMAQMEYKVKE